jgi:hypothetical protein
LEEDDHIIDAFEEGIEMLFFFFLGLLFGCCAGFLLASLFQGMPDDDKPDNVIHRPCRRRD